MFKNLSLAAALVALASAAPKPNGGGSACTTITATEASRVTQAFSDAGFFPSALPAFTPSILVGADYAGHAVDLGNEFTTLETTMEPTYTLSAEQGYDPTTTKYLMLFLDPDAPTKSSPQLIDTLIDDFVHHIQQDLQPACVADQSPQDVRMYLGPTPPSLSSHRYMFLVYRQPPGFQAPAETRAMIFGLKLGEFVERTGVQLVGGNFFLEGLGSNLPPA